MGASSSRAASPRVTTARRSAADLDGAIRTIRWATKCRSRKNTAVWPSRASFMSIEQIVTDSPGHNAGTMLEPRIRRRRGPSATRIALQSARRAGPVPSRSPAGGQPGSGSAARRVGCRRASELGLVVLQTALEAAKINRQLSNHPPRRTTCGPSAACKRRIRASDDSTI